MKKAFTLIELLMVISIISLLASIVIGSFSDIRSKARDSKRLADLKSLQTALNMAAINGNLPDTFGDIALNAVCSPYTERAYYELDQALVGGGYIGEVPVDPVYSAIPDGDAQCGGAYWHQGYWFRNTTGGNGWIAGDTDPATWALQFRFENNPYSGSGSVWTCLTSTGFHRAGTLPGEGANQCLQG